MTRVESRFLGTVRGSTRAGPGRFAVPKRAYVHAEQVRLLDRPEDVFGALLGAIEEARSRILVECYWFEDDATGVRFASALALKARAGVDVAVLYDAIGSITTSGGFWDALEEAGVKVVAFHPPSLWRAPWLLHRRDHRKIIGVDGRVVYVGGVYSCDENAPTSWGGEGWCDAVVEVRGAEAVARFERVFFRTWARIGGSPLRPVVIASEGIPPTGPLIAVLANRLFRERFVIRRAYLHAIRKAKESVWIANPYFIPDGNVRRALTRAARRGVDVRVLVPRKSDNALTDAASRGLFGRLLRRGVRIYASDGPMLHAKTIVVDGAWGAVGSYNLDNRSLRYNMDVAAAVLDEPYAAGMRQSFERNLGSARAISFDEWARRSRLERVAEWGASLLSAYL